MYHTSQWMAASEIGMIQMKDWRRGTSLDMGRLFLVQEPPADLSLAARRANEALLQARGYPPAGRCCFPKQHESIVDVQKHLGHADTRSTTIYAQFTDEANRERAERLRDCR